MSFEINTNNLLKLSDKDSEKGTNLIIKICENILHNPTNTKYQSLNIQNLHKKLKFECFIDLLLQGGFEKSQDGQKLIFDVKRLDDLKMMKNWVIRAKQSILTKYEIITINDDKKRSYDLIQVRQLMDAGLTEQEAIKAIQLSLETDQDNQHNNCNSDISAEVSELINMGCTKKEAIEAIKLSMTDLCVNNSKITKHKNMDMEEAEKYLVTIGYESKAAMKAFVSAKYDIDIAVNKLNSENTDGNEQKITRPNDPLVSSMTAMGFSEHQSICALQFCGGNINMAINSIVQGDCYGLIKECKYLPRLIKTIKKYNTTQDQNNNDVQMILNDFNHLLIKHDSDADFDYIYECFGECDIKTCTQLKRHHRNKELLNEMKNVSLLRNVIDKIHSHFVHCYDIGLRFTATERQKLIQNIDNKVNDEDDYKSVNINAINIPKSKRHLRQRFTNIKLSNKFHQIDAPRNCDVYSFGERFYYWGFFKHCDVEDVCNHGYRYYQWYVSPKHKSLKQELTDNKVAKIGYSQWNHEYKKASIYHSSLYCRTIIAEIQPHPHPHQNTQLFCIPNGEQITINHLLSIIVYCSYSNLSTKFSATFRRLSQINNTKNQHSKSEIKLNDVSSLRSVNCTVENDESLKQRNSNFYYLSKYINEAVNIYSRQSKDVCMMRFYHGIDKEMIFDSMKGFMFQPLSTTSAWEVAVNFSMNSGMVVELNCHPNSRYFDCAWVSDYSSERELLFISCSQPLIFVNITNVVTEQDFRLFMKAISIIEWSTAEHLLSSDNFEVYRNMINEERKQGVYKLPSYNPKLYGAKIINPTIKLLAVKLIKHELNRYEPTKYEKYIDVPEYIDTLLHNICIKKTWLFINWKWMNVEMTNEYMFEKNGYLGYLFLKNVFFEKLSPIVNWCLIGTLYPNLKGIVLQEIPNFSTTYLDDILGYLLSNRSEHLRMIDLSFDKEATNQLPGLSFFSDYKFQFLNAGWDIMYSIHERSMQMFNMKYFTADRAVFRNPGYL